MWGEMIGQWKSLGGMTNYEDSEKSIWKLGFFMCFMHTHECTNIYIHMHIIFCVFDIKEFI